MADVTYSSLVKVSKVDWSIWDHFSWNPLNHFSFGPFIWPKHTQNIIARTDSKMLWRHAGWRSAVRPIFSSKNSHAPLFFPVLEAVVPKPVAFTLSLRFQSCKVSNTAKWTEDTLFQYRSSRLQKVSGAGFGARQVCPDMRSTTLAMLSTARLRRIILNQRA